MQTLCEISSISRLFISCKENSFMSHLLPRRAGVLLHPTSLPSSTGIGEIGSEAYSFIDWLHSAQVGTWQILPLVPAGSGYSPYSSWSSCAGNSLLISIKDLISDGWLPESAAQECIQTSIDWVYFEKVSQQKKHLLDQASNSFIQQQAHLTPAFQEFLQQEKYWLDDAALFYVIGQVHDNIPWWNWPEEIRTCTTKALTQWRREYADQILAFKVVQFFFQYQWQALKSYCEVYDIEIIGDLPIYVDHNSVDVWANQHLFQLSDEGIPLAVSGVPPDAFSETGQLWGNPLYDWQQMDQDSYKWWVNRLQRAVSLTHRVRIDHFRAFAFYWKVDYGHSDARQGEWVQGPGMKIFDILREHFTDLPFIAEDLGLIDQPVRDLLDASGLPGMKVLQFAFGEGKDNVYLPHRHIEKSIVYTGTHDNDTSLGWWAQSNFEIQDHARRYLAVDGHDIVWDLIRVAMRSVAHLSVIPMQDLLTLGSSTRMNTPSEGEGNWRWRVRKEAFNESVASRLRDLIYLYGRNKD